MKKLPLLMLTMLTLPANAQSILKILTEHQNTLHTQPQTGTSSPTSTSRTAPDVKPSTEQTTSNTIRCESQDQTSLPLAYVTSLIQAENGQLNITHNQKTGSLTVSTEDMIGNCASMLQWTLKRPTIQGQPAYALEVKIKEGNECDESGCTYKVAKVENGSFQKFETMKFKPTLKGFEECIQKSGVIKNGKVDPKAIYNEPVNEKFDGLKESGKFYFLSNGPESKQVKPKYGKYEYINGCDHYEAAHPTIRSLLTYEDAERERLDAEAAKLKECKVEEYGKLAEFIEKYENYQSELGEVRDRLILEAAKKSAAAIESGKYKEEDLKVIEDFDRYVVQPKIKKAVEIYDEMIELEGDEQKAKREELVKVLQEIAALGRAPYFQAKHTQRLINDGQFDAAEKLNTAKLMIDNYQRLGAQEQNVRINPRVARDRVSESQRAFAQTLATEKEKYMYRTGQETGNAAYYKNKARLQRNAIEIRTRNFTNEIQLEYQRMQYGGYCYKYYRNTQKCLQDSMTRIQELQTIMTRENQRNQTEAERLEALAKEWEELEAQGRRYIAAQYGQEVPAEEPRREESREDSSLNPSPRREEQQPSNPYGMSTFQWTGGAQGTQQISPYQNNNMFMQQQNPYGMYQQQQPYLGQQSYQQSPYGYYGQQGMTTFNWNGGGMQQPQQQYGMYPQQQQMPYYNQPYQAYGNYNMYGGYRGF